MGLRRDRDRPVLPCRRRLGRRRPHAHQPRHRRPRHGHRPPPATGRSHLPLRPRQYTSSAFDTHCKKNKVRRSLGRTGICYDNAVSESFFATYKKELIHTRPWPTLADLKRETADWIENHFNTTRRHSTLEYLTPREYELGYRHIGQLAA
ncbi:hypothetical protein Franean1_7055 [Parafrankia sp. EAN1pec]|nr:hypothetical protein Franean1_7055 [Frankia sp. EAN1pec]